MATGTGARTDAGPRRGRSIRVVAPVTPIVAPGVAAVPVGSIGEPGGPASSIAEAAARSRADDREESRPQALPLELAGTPAATAPAVSTVPTLSST